MQWSAPLAFPTTAMLKTQLVSIQILADILVYFITYQCTSWIHSTCAQKLCQKSGCYDWWRAYLLRSVLPRLPNFGDILVYLVSSSSNYPSLILHPSCPLHSTCMVLTPAWLSTMSLTFLLVGLKWCNNLHNSIWPTVPFDFLEMP